MFLPKRGSIEGCKKELAQLWDVKDCMNMYYVLFYIVLAVALSFTGLEKAP